MRHALKLLWLLGGTLVLCVFAVALARIVVPRDAGSPLSHQRLDGQQANHDFSRRAMIAFGSFDRSNELRRRGYYAVWCYLPRVRKKTVHHWKQSTSIFERAQVVSRDTGIGQETAIFNGGYFDFRAHFQPRQALIGEAGNGQTGRWSRGSPPARRVENQTKYFQRWAFGFNEDFSGADDFSIGLMQPRPAFKGFIVPRAIESRHAFGFSGLLCLIRNGQPEVRRENNVLHLNPSGQWGEAGRSSDTEFRDGYYRRAAIGWTKDGRHLFLVVHHHPDSVLATRDLFARYRASKYSGPGELLRDLKIEWQKLPPHQRPCAEKDLPARIENAMLLDGGRSATLIYTRRETTSKYFTYGSWLTGAQSHAYAPRVPTTIEAIESD